MRVRLGLTLLSKVDEFVVTKTIRRVIEHPKHRGLEAYFDVAIIDMDQVDAIALNVNFTGARI